MFIGHYGIALGAHALYPAAPLPVLMVATQAIDICWAGLVLGGVEKVEIRQGATRTTPLDPYHMPYSHSLGGALAISALCAVLSLGLGLSGQAAWVVFAVAFSHWILDLIVHVRTLVLVGNRPKVGFGLWQNRPAAVGLEYAIIVAGAAAYALRFGLDGRWLPFVLLVLAGLAVQSAAFFGKPAKSPRELVLAMLALFVAFAAVSIWLDQSGMF